MKEKKHTSIRMDPVTQSALDFLRDRRVGGFNLTQAVSDMITREAKKQGWVNHLEKQHVAPRDTAKGELSA